jgi:hypothetical protein
MMDNPNLPTDSVGLSAFNLIPGAAFMLIDQPDPRVWVAEKVVRDENFERVSVWAHDATHNPDLPFEQAFNLDYCTQVALVGIVVNPTDPDDNNWGNA